VQPGGVQVDVVVGQHEAHAFVFGQRFAKGLAAAGVFERDVVFGLVVAEAHRPEQQRARAPTVAGRPGVAPGASARLVGAALDKGLVDPTPVVLRCLRDCVHGAGKADLVVRLNPQDLAAVQERLRDNAELRQEIADARFVADPVVPRGGVRAETGAGRLLYDPQEVLARICAEVRREVSS
jgi:hypothetical protein